MSDFDIHGLTVTPATGSRVLYKQVAFTGSNLPGQPSTSDFCELAAPSVGSDGVQGLPQPCSTRSARPVTFTENHDSGHTVTMIVKRKGSNTYVHYIQLIYK